MAAELTFPSTAENHLRRLDARRDLEAVADLVELCFAETLDQDGRNYLRSMREAARSARLMSWTNAIQDQSPNPLTGIVWEEDGRLIGNTSLIPIMVEGRRSYLIANVAVHPDWRGRGIGRMLTARAMEFAHRRGLSEVWLQVRDDNAPAINIYTGLGFQERARRTAWSVAGEIPKVSPPEGVSVGPRRAEHWAQQRLWLQQLYPPEFSWHFMLGWNSLRPGLLWSFYRFFAFDYPRQWAVTRRGALQGVLAWKHATGTSGSLWLAVPPQVDEEALLALLVYIRKRVPRPQPLTLNIPAGLADGALHTAGFFPHQTLIWMEYRF